ncbi:mitochondrial intermembrane space import and assembly protein 40 homolog isoform X2 [Diospyros lotus]|uniref:mitochondrial intermembrane space import and assembly protein 40 homolog isoform X2 n=1 Tax=Diospyros lotus TaxID=55363 RepID=UPI00224CC5A0|nr:mitochondrial intermembrane space import and assembly protein 40 homolog isoform X2 [Diospyros lotus]
MARVDNSSQSEPPSLESLIAEATTYGDSENESLDAKAQKALECPCIANLRNGSCGAQFSEAFLCFLKSTAEEKKCIKVNPDAFSEDVLDDEDEVKKEVEPTKEYKIIPPEWSVASRSPKQKL